MDVEYFDNVKEQNTAIKNDIGLLEFVFLCDILLCCLTLQCMVFLEDYMLLLDLENVGEQW